MQYNMKKDCLPENAFAYKFSKGMVICKRNTGACSDQTASQGIRWTCRQVLVDELKAAGKRQEIEEKKLPGLTKKTGFEALEDELYF